MKNTIEWFQGNDGELRPALATGDMVTLDVSLVREPPLGSASERVEPDGQNIAMQAVDVVATSTAAPLELVSPSHRVTPLALTGDQLTLGRLLETGLWTVRQVNLAGEKPILTPTSTESATEGTDAENTTLVACNLVNAEESDLRPRGELEELQGRNLAILGGQSLWFYLTLAATLLIATEWWLYQRRIVG
jgi:hypothetical protein